MIVNEKGISLRDAWDGVNLRFTFTRTVDRRLMNMWLELKQIVSLVELVEEEDSIIWQYNSSGRYSVQSLYAIVNDRGVKPVYTPMMWNIFVTSRVHIFLWLLSNNKTLTRDNLGKRKELEDNRCLFCNELESVAHLFFECCVARVVWNEIAEISGKEIGTDFESVARWWVADKQYKVLNVCSAAAFWAIWKLRNEFCFQGAVWSGVQVLLRRIARMLWDWRLLNKLEVGTTLEV
jgi:hypothetical protein